jgi:hypothetical protein
MEKAQLKVLDIRDVPIRVRKVNTVAVLMAKQWRVDQTKKVVV